MNIKNIALISALISVGVAVQSCSVIESHKVLLVDAKMATAVDADFMPVGVTDMFPAGTERVTCWIKWKDSKINTEIIAKWHYLTDDVHIVDYPFSIPKREGSGGITITMPGGKKFPAGSYKVDLYLEKRLIKTLQFRVG
jgi:hypothetical protein